MRRKKNREINIFSMSALDLFASALGAFILIAIIALPYYLKTVKVKNPPVSAKELASLQQQLEQLKKENDNLSKEVEQNLNFAILGILSNAKSFVILIDMSGSMGKYTDTIRSTFERIINGLTNKHQIQVIGFQGESSATLHEWQRPRNLLYLNSTNKSGAKRFMSSLSSDFGSGTPTHEALLEALKYESEGILLLTDGAPNGDYLDIVSDITAKNGGKKEIHCIAIGDYREDLKLVDFLEKLAKQNRGGFIGVSNINP